MSEGVEMAEVALGGMPGETILETSVGPVRLRRSSRKTLAISVLPSGEVELTAPAFAEEQILLEKIDRRRRWIAKKRQEFSRLNVSAKAPVYVSGATHRYLGKQYRLKVVEVGNTGQNQVRLRGAFFIIEERTISVALTKKLMDQWMKEKAREQFTRRLEPWHDWCRRHDLPRPELQIHAMPKRWGSSLPSGKILLNPLLVRTSSVCIDYVIAHEVCHLKEPYHNAAFFRLLGRLVPNWRDVKLRLEQAEL